jgi:hypothetical protein
MPNTFPEYRWVNFPLCNLCVLCVSVVLLNHRDTENTEDTEVVQRRRLQED